MYAQIYYLVRSKADGQYLVARFKPEKARSDDQPADETVQSYLLVFREHFEALSYLNAHGQDLVDRFGVESVPGSQLDPLLRRWGFQGIGIVQDPLLPKVEFLSR